MASIPSFTATPQIDIAQVTTANTARDGTGTPVTVITGAAAPNYVKPLSAVVKAIVTTTAGAVRFFITNDAGTTWRLIHEMSVTATTAGASTNAFEDTYVFPEDLVLPSASYKIGATTEKTETFNIIALSAKM